MATCLLIADMALKFKANIKININKQHVVETVFIFLAVKIVL